MSFALHGVRVGLLMAVTAGMLTWMSARSALVYADGLRYIRQAIVIDHGDVVGGLLRAVDHPVYPMAIALAHRAVGGEGPMAWESAAQAASVLAGVLLIIPLYLVALELFGPRAAWLGVLLALLAPSNARVLADALSEGTFLLFWLWGLWAALRFLKRGTFVWLPLMVGFNALAYLTRPEALLLPLTMVATLMTMPLLAATRLNWPRWGAAIAFLVLGPICLAGPYMAIKGGVGTKPAIARLLGTAPRSAHDAVERARPLDPNQTEFQTYTRAIKVALEAVRDAATVPMLPLAVVGLWVGWPAGSRARIWLFLGLLYALGLAGLVRLHATGGYCTPRHAMVLGIPLILAAGAGLDWLLRSLTIPGRWIGEPGTLRPGPAAWVLALAALVAWTAPRLAEPLNASFRGYRQAAEWLANNPQAATPVVDVTGWSLFYSWKEGYTFANLYQAEADPATRYVVVRENHLHGPWWYCQQFRILVNGRQPVAVFPGPDDQAGPRAARVLIFDRHQVPVLTEGGPASTPRAG